MDETFLKKRRSLQEMKLRRAEAAESAPKRNKKQYDYKFKRLETFVTSYHKLFDIFFVKLLLSTFYDYFYFKRGKQAQRSKQASLRMKRRTLLLKW